MALWQQIVDAISDNDTDLFIEILSKIRALSSRGNIRKQVELYYRKMSIIDNILCLCTIYNRPKMLAKCETAEVLPTKRGYGEKSLRVAEIMDYQDCLKELARLFPYSYSTCSRSQITKDFRLHLVKELIDLSKIGCDKNNCNIPSDVIKMTYRRLLGDHINELNKSGQSFIHEVILDVDITYQNLSVLLEIGCDINMLDSSGQTAFLVFCRSRFRDNYCPYYAGDFNDFAIKLQLFIMENPSVRLSDSADYHVLMYEIEHFKQRNKRRPLNSELLSFSLSTLLHKHGFEFSCTIRDGQPNEEEQTLLRQVRLVHGVRKLSEICKIVLRQHYTGKAIHTFVKSDSVPKQLKDYILLKDMIQF